MRELIERRFAAAKRRLGLAAETRPLRTDLFAPPASTSGSCACCEAPPGPARKSEWFPHATRGKFRFFLRSRAVAPIFLGNRA